MLEDLEEAPGVVVNQRMEGHFLSLFHTVFEIKKQNKTKGLFNCLIPLLYWTNPKCLLAVFKTSYLDKMANAR